MIFDALRPNAPTPQNSAKTSYVEVAPSPPKLLSATLLSFDAPALFNAGAALIEVRAGSRLALEETELQTTLTLFAGRVALDVLPSDERLARFAVLTPTAQIETVGAAFWVRVDETGTQAHIEEGEVHATTQLASRPLIAGELLSTKVPPPSIKKPKLQRPRPRPKSPPKKTEIEPMISAARALLRTEPGRAFDMLFEILERPMSPRLNLEVLSVLADAARRHGQNQRAASFYKRVANHGLGAGYAEEALLRRARLLHSIKDIKGALEALQEAAKRFERGPLLPERRLLQAKLHLELNEAERAAIVLSHPAPWRATTPVQRLRQETARALLSDQPDRACALFRLIPRQWKARDVELSKRCADFSKNP